MLVSALNGTRVASRVARAVGRIVIEGRGVRVAVIETSVGVDVRVLVAVGVRVTVGVNVSDGTGVSVGISVGAGVGASG